MVQIEIGIWSFIFFGLEIADLPSPLVDQKMSAHPVPAYFYYSPDGLNYYVYM
jgi:hypothetical protein